MFSMSTCRSYTSFDLHVCLTSKLDMRRLYVLYRSTSRTCIRQCNNTFAPFSGEATSFWTTADYPDWSYNTTWISPRQDWLTFELQGKEWVTIAVSRVPGQIDTQCFEIHIGIVSNLKMKQYDI